MKEYKVAHLRWKHHIPHNFFIYDSILIIIIITQLIIANIFQ